jgi:hypothetical protein
MLIIGAGLSGLIAATQFPKAEVIEANKEHSSHHRALLRFRSGDIGKAVGIPFNPVRVHKAVWDGRLRSRANIAEQNAYSLKVTGKMLSRSIGDLRTVNRWVAPEDFVDQLYDMVKHRVSYNCPASRILLAGFKGPIISTMPMFLLAEMFGEESMFDDPYFNYSRIIVQRFHIPDADVYQTIYYPDKHMPVYRASITGNLLIIEGIDDIDEAAVQEVKESFGITQLLPVDQSTQKFGKIAPIDESQRQAFIMKMTMEHSIYSLGRFAIWRNILLDDVLIDIERIASMVKMGSYHRYLKGVMK